MLSYAYNTSRQLVEIIRSATDTKPESIISYTRDSSGNILHLREDVGSMQRTHSRTYDILGRVTSETDYTGRVTTWLYAQYGLKETVVYPSGAQATLIKNKDGSTHSYAAVGRRTIVYHYEPSSHGVKVTRKLEDGRVLGYVNLTETASSSIPANPLSSSDGLRPARPLEPLQREKPARLLHGSRGSDAVPV